MKNLIIKVTFILLAVLFISSCRDKEKKDNFEEELPVDDFLIMGEFPSLKADTVIFNRKLVSGYQMQGNYRFISDDQQEKY